MLDDVTKAQCWALRLKNPQVYMYMIFKLPVHKLFIVNMYVMLAVLQQFDFCHLLRSIIILSIVIRGGCYAPLMTMF